MKHSRHAPSATSLPRAPHDDDRLRVRRYAITMGIRMLCFILMAVVTPYGWYTWLFALGAIFLPYIAVVKANAGQDSRAAQAQSPELELPSPSAEQDTSTDSASPTVFRISEQRPEDGKAP